MSFGARAHVRLDALKANFKLLSSQVPGARVMAAVKANAYGHGIVEVSKALPNADALAVARLIEAESLRTAGIRNSIVLMGGVTTADELERAAELSCDLVVHTPLQIDLLERKRVSPLKIWLKIDTGMHRLGFDIEDVPAAIKRLEHVAGDLGLMTHLANADDTTDPMSGRQFERLMTIAEGFHGDLSIANSAALLGWAESLTSIRATGKDASTWIRPGISLYGISPLKGRTAQELGLEPVMNFDTTLLAVRRVPAGEAVGYGGRWTASEDTVIGIAAAGYGDGYSRFLPSNTPVLVNGRRVPLAGVISMDLLAVDLGPRAEDKVGDPVRLWGEGLPVEEVASHADTTAYPLVTGVQQRAHM